MRKYKNAMKRKDFRNANKITIPMFYDLYKFKNQSSTKGS